MRLIDADAFVQFLKDTVIRQKYENLKIDGLLTVADVIEAIISDLDGTSFDGFKNAPTIEPETEEEAYERGYTAGQMAQRKKGHWTGENACEFCGFQPWFERDIHTLSYCPNCGAKMEGVRSDGTD